jgi:hypothetical protein
VIAPAVDFPVRIADYAALTALGDAARTHAALVAGESALRLLPTLGAEGGELVPLALTGPMVDGSPPRWLAELENFVAPLRDAGWGRARTPVFIASSNFGVDGFITHLRTPGGNPAAAREGVVSVCVTGLRERFGWGKNTTVLSHACVSAQLALMQATRVLRAGEADRALVFAFDFLSPFVSGGFQSLKILNSRIPAPYAARDTGSIGLGDGAAYAVLTRATGDFRIRAQHTCNEMWHFTANDPSGDGFTGALAPLAASGKQGRLWFKGHGTGTLEPGALECAAAERAFPSAPIVGWKGAIGHTLGSSALVELAIALESFRTGLVPGTVGTTGKCFSDNVATTAFKASGFDGAVMACNAFGGAHASMLVTHA